MSPSNLLLGIDGGGTKTECYLARGTSGADEPDIEIIGQGRAAASNPRTVGIQPACAALDRAIDAAFRDANLDRTTAHSCVIGLAGAGRADIRQTVADWAAKSHLAAVIEVVPDFELPLAAAAPDEIGIALISGTGSVAFGRGSSGETGRAGGWGYLLGDAGSGYAIGREGIEAACRAEDGCRMPTSLTQSIPRHFGVASMRDVAELIYESPDPRTAIAGVAPILFAESERGDVLSRKTLDVARAALSEMVGALAHKLGLDGAPFTLALAGSVLIHEPTFAKEIVAGLDDWCKVLPTPVLVPEPVVGALQMALRRLGGQQPADRGVHRAGG